MANTDNKTGLRPVRHRNGGKIVQNEYSIESTLAETIGKGHPVQMTGTGRNVIMAEATNADNIGVFAGCEWTPTNGGKRVFSKYWPTGQTGTDIVAYVWDDPDIIFEIQADNCVAADIGLQCDWNAGTPSTVTGLSGAYAVVVAETTNNALRVEKLVPRADNAYGDYAKIEVTFAEHVLKGVVAGVGGV